MRTPFPTLEAAGCAFAASLAVAAPGAAASAGAPAWLGALIAAAAMAAGCLLCCAGIGEAMAARQSEALAAHWEDGLPRYRAFKAEAGREPRALAKDSAERGVGVWLADALRLADAGELPRRAALAIAEVDGPISPERAAAMPESPYGAREAAPAPMALRTLLAACCAAAGAGACWTFGPCAGGAFAVREALLLLATLATASLAACDHGSRMLPARWSALVWALGAAAALIASPRSFAAWAAVAAFYAAAMGLGSLALKALGRKNSVGAGDLRLAPACAAACGPEGSIFGLACAIAAMAAHYLPRLADYRLRADSLVPMGAFLHIWLCAGLAWPAIASLT